MGDSVESADALSPGKVVAVAFLGHFAWALWAAFQHPGLGYESDRVANWLYYQSLVSGAPRLADLWYFPVPKILPVVLLGPLADGPGEILVMALLAGALAAAATWIVSRSFGIAAGAATAVLLAADPRWTRLVAMASADFLVAVGIAGVIVAWMARRERLAAVVIMLATLVKTPAAAAALPLLFDRERSLRAKVWLVVAGIAGCALTSAGYALLLGDASKPLGFHTAYTELRGAAVPSVYEWLGKWLANDIYTELLPFCWPLAVVGLVATCVVRRAQPMRQWLVASLAAGVGFVVLAVSTGTLLFARFLWSLEVWIVASCAIGAIVVGRGVAHALDQRQHAAAAGAAIAGLLLFLTAIGPVRSAAGDGGRYTVLFEYGARTALPWLDAARADMAPGDRLIVPLWFQPAAMWKLRGQVASDGVEAAEVVVARDEVDRAQADWLLLAPAYVENSATQQWTYALASQGYETVASSELPRMKLLRHASPHEPRS